MRRLFIGIVVLGGCSVDSATLGANDLVADGGGLRLTDEDRLAVDPGVTQARVQEDGCPEGQSIRVIAESGAVTCEQDDDTTYQAGEGLTLTDTTFAVDFTTVARLGASLTCAGTQKVTGIDPATGDVTCDDDLGGTDYFAGAGLDLAGDGTFSVEFVDFTCMNSQKISAFDSAGMPVCTDDIGGTVYTNGEGLSLISGAFSVDFGGNGLAPTASRSDHNHTYDSLSDKPPTFPPDPHAHVHADLTDERPLPWRFRYGLNVEYVEADVTASTVRIHPGRCRDKDDTMNIVLAADDDASILNASPPDADTDEVTEAPDTWYWVWIIADSTGTNAPRAFISVFETAPLYPSGYDRGRLLGAVRNDPAADFLPFSQHGTTTMGVHQKQVIYPVNVQGSYTSVSLTSSVPPRTQWAQMFVITTSTNDDLVFSSRDPDVPSATARAIHHGQNMAIATAGGTVWVPVGGPIESESVEVINPNGNAWEVWTIGYDWGPQEP